MATHDQVRDVLNRAVEVHKEYQEKSARLIEEAVELFEKAELAETGSARETFKKASDRMLEASESARSAVQLAESVIYETSQILNGSKVIGAER